MSPGRPHEERPPFRRVLRLYAGAPPATRLFLLLRLLVCPFHQVAGFVPDKGTLLDLGCGHGLFLNMLRLSGKALALMGLDADPARISAAKQSMRHPPAARAKLACQDIASGPYPPADIITILDVLYLLPQEEQKAVIGFCRESLPAGGLLLLLESGTRPAWKRWWARTHEALTVRLLKLTRGGPPRFFPPEHYRQMLTRAGFSVEPVRLDRGYPYPHLLFVARKTG